MSAFGVTTFLWILCLPVLQCFENAPELLSNGCLAVYKTCPCGDNGKVTVPVRMCAYENEAKMEMICRPCRPAEDPCLNFTKCKTCSAEEGKCLTCPDDYMGKYCNVKILDYENEWSPNVAIYQVVIRPLASESHGKCHVSDLNIANGGCFLFESRLLCYVPCTSTFEEDGTFAHLECKVDSGEWYLTSGEGCEDTFLGRIVKSRRRKRWLLGSFNAHESARENA